MANEDKHLQRILDESVVRAAARLVEFREAAGLNIQQIINATGLSRSGISKIEEGRANPTVRSIESYVMACGRSLSEFFEPWTAVSEGSGNGRKRTRRSA